MRKRDHVIDLTIGIVATVFLSVYTVPPVFATNMVHCVQTSGRYMSETGRYFSHVLFGIPRLRWPYDEWLQVDNNCKKTDVRVYSVNYLSKEGRRILLETMDLYAIHVLEDITYCDIRKSTLRAGKSLMLNKDIRDDTRSEFEQFGSVSTCIVEDEEDSRKARGWELICKSELNERCERVDRFGKNNLKWDDVLRRYFSQ